MIESVGVVAVAIGQPLRGTRLLGAAGALRERVGHRHRVMENEAALDLALSDARAALGDDAFRTAWAAGRNLSPAQAMDESLATFLVPLVPSIVLTRREEEILGLVADGLSNPAIAGRLYISVRTVENHVAHIMAKFQVTTRGAAVEAAIAAGLLPTPPIPPD